MPPFRQVSPALPHGGGLAAAPARQDEPPQGWIDLSTGINPWAYPYRPIPQESYERLPDQGGLARLLEAARRYYRLPDQAALVAAGGSQACLSALPQLLPPCSVAILGFTYAEHAHRWRLNGHEVRIVSTLREAAAYDVAIVVNPNNPDGRVFEVPALVEMSEILAAKSGLLIIDEAFADTDPHASLAPFTGRKGLIVLRSFGKFFGLAGVRLGFAIGPQDLIDPLSAWLGPWIVSGPAIEIGIQGVSDENWIREMRSRLAGEAAGLRQLLESCGLSVIGGTALFQLAQSPLARDLAERLECRGVLVRQFQQEPHWLRFGLPPSRAASERLRQALKAIE